MTNSDLRKVKKFNNGNRTRCSRKILAVMGCFVMFLTMGMLMLPAQTEGEVSFESYLNENEGNLEFILMSESEEILEPDAGGNHIVDAEETYILSVAAEAAGGIAPGEYVYEMPDGVSVKEIEGKIVLETPDVDESVSAEEVADESDAEESAERAAGTWSAEETGVITFTIGDIAEIHEAVSVSADIPVCFNGDVSPVFFSGKLNVMTSDNSGTSETGTETGSDDEGAADTEEEPLETAEITETEGSDDEDTVTDVDCSINIVKIDALTGNALSEAVFGIYTEAEVMLDSGVTDETGSICFETAIDRSIVLNGHVPYYIQEIEAPAGYMLSDDKYWIVFCDNSEDECDECSLIMADHSGMVRMIQGDETAVTVENMLCEYTLPETGGCGTAVWYISGLMIMCAAGVMLTFNYKRCRKDS